MTHGIGIMLLSAAAGYWVLERAEAHKGQLRQVGRVVGAAVIVVSLAFTIFQIVLMATGECAMDGMRKGGMCPFAPRATMPMPTK